MDSSGQLVKIDVSLLFMDHCVATLDHDYFCLSMTEGLWMGEEEYWWTGMLLKKEVSLSVMPRNSRIGLLHLKGRDNIIGTEQDFVLV
jgi:hypothetical protein